MVRMALALLNCLAIHHLRKALVKTFGTTAGYAFILICCTQFHLLFYMGRPLPNTFAMALITFAFGYYLDEVPLFAFFSPALHSVHLSADILLRGGAMRHAGALCTVPTLAAAHRSRFLPPHGDPGHHIGIALALPQRSVIGMSPRSS